MILRTWSQQPVAIGWHLCPILVGLVLSGFLGVAGCTKESLEPVQTVEWYKTHEAERMAVLQKCMNNPGQLEGTPNCVNARGAADALFRGQ
jgi:hypothetical protein